MYSHTDENGETADDAGIDTTPAVKADGTTEEAAETDGVSSVCTEILEELRKYNQRLTDHLTTVARCNQSAFDRLYAELEQYKGNFLLDVQRGLLLDIILLYDGLRKCLMHYRQTDTVDREALLSNLEGLMIDSEGILARRDVLPITDSPATLDRHTQKAVEIVPTAIKEEDLVIARKVRTGFMIGTRVFRREEVVIKQYVPTGESTPTKTDKNR
jgi:molecular chaperone GrpE (heat shock protein)